MTDDGARPDGDGTGPGGLVDWRATGRRVRLTAAAVAVLVVLAWLVAGLLGDGVALADLGDWIGLGLGVVVLGEVVVVGGAAVRAERRAAVRGERLSGSDVGLLPPRIRGRTSAGPASGDEAAGGAPDEAAAGADDEPDGRADDETDGGADDEADAAA